MRWGKPELGASMHLSGGLQQVRSLSRETQRQDPAETPARGCTAEPYHAGPGWPRQ